jgi:putative ABC transport system permease protein
MFWESVKMSWGNIAHNKLRSFLTMLGIVIGVASVIALITIVQGATASVTSQISSLGADDINVSAPGTALKLGLNEQDLAKITALANVAGVSPTVSGSTSVVYGHTVKTGVSVYGHNEVYFRKNADKLAEGRLLNILDVQGKNRTAVLGSSLARDLFFGIDPVGRQILVGGATYTVAGVLKAESGFTLNSVNDAVLVPYPSAMSTLGVRSISSVDVYMADPGGADALIGKLKTVLNQAFNYHDDAYLITNMQDILSTINNITGMMSMMLGGIAAISLIVGGIGIMNMMLVSVTERTAEIGLRKALGAEPARIQLQFLIESVFISLFGGMIGMILGFAISLIASAVINIPFVFTASTVLLAVGFSAGIGIVFGLAPARKASRLNPIDALRRI